MAYCTADSLLIGQIQTAAGETEQYAEIGAEEMNAELGMEYQLPLATANGDTPLPRVLALLAKINRLISSGRLILARNATVDDSLHAYGVSLLQEGRALLGTLVSGSVQLEGIVRVVREGDLTGGRNGPAILNGDASSGVDAYYDWMNHDLTHAEHFRPGGIWRPG